MKKSILLFISILTVLVTMGMFSSSSEAGAAYGVTLSNPGTVKVGEVVKIKYRITSKDPMTCNAAVTVTGGAAISKITASQGTAYRKSAKIGYLVLSGTGSCRVITGTIKLLVTSKEKITVKLTARTASVNTLKDSSSKAVVRLKVKGSVTSPDDPSSDPIASGKFKSGIRWSLSKAGVLSINGTGKMGTYSRTKAMPWNDYRTKIKSVVISSGITNICGSAFYGCTKLVSCSIPSSVTSIGHLAFGKCTSLTSLAVSEKVKTIDSLAFYGDSKLQLSVPTGSNAHIYALKSGISFTENGKVTFKITYSLSKGTNSIKNPSAYTYDMETIKLKDPTREGYVFLGLYTDAAKTQCITEINPLNRKNYRLYAKWKKAS